MLTWLNKLFPFMLFCGDDDSSSDNEAKYEAAVAPAREQQQIMTDLFKTAYQPYVQDIAGLWSAYGKPAKEAQYSAYSQTLPKLLADVEQPMTLPDSVWQGTWQKAREKTAGEYDTITRKTSQRLASTGGLGQGPGNQLMQQIDFNKAKSIESQAIDQAIAEWNEKKAAKQQAYSNLFTALNYNPESYNALSGLGNYQTSVIPPYMEEENQGNYSGLGSLLGMGALGAASLLIPGSGIGLAGLTGLDMTLLGGAAGGGLGSLFSQ